jgi:AraC-like DNA-binding protein
MNDMEINSGNSAIFSSFEGKLHSTEDPGFPLGEHWHYFAEIIRVCAGSLKVQRGSRVILLNEGDAVFITPLLRHSLGFAAPGVRAEYEIFRLDMELLGDLPSYTPDLRGLVLEAERLGLSMVFTADDLQKESLNRILDNCMKEHLTRGYGYDLRIRSLLYLFVTSLVRRWIANGFTPQNSGAGIDPIYTLPSYIANHIQDPLKVEDLAEFCGLSYPWFARKFHSIYGISCKEYIERIRIRRVEHYLQFTDCDLNYISQHTGYADCSHLVRDFRKFRNTTPGQFRQACRQKPHGGPTFPKTIDT